MAFWAFLGRYYSWEPPHTVTSIRPIVSINYRLNTFIKLKIKPMLRCLDKRYSIFKLEPYLIDPLSLILQMPLSSLGLHLSRNLTDAVGFCRWLQPI